MKILIVYYSRTGITKEISEILKEKLSADIEQIQDGDKYKGTIGYLKGGFEAMRNKQSQIKETSKNPANYNLTIIASPVWASHVVPGISSYIKQNKKYFNEVAAFVTCGSSGGEKTLEQISKECGKPLNSSMILTKKDIETELYKKINTFIDKLDI